MLQKLLEDRRLSLGYGWEDFGRTLGVYYTNLFRFCRGSRPLSQINVRAVARYAISQDDNELLSAAASYALGQPVRVELAN